MRQTISTAQGFIFAELKFRMVEFDASNNEEQVRAAENNERNGKMEVPHPPLSLTGKLQTASLKQVRNAYIFQTIRLTNICFESYVKIVNAELLITWIYNV